MANINQIKTQDGTLYDIEDSTARAGAIAEVTASGNPITLSAFPTEADVSMTIAPTQSLNGYTKPWAGGAGKNKLPLVLSIIKTHNTGGTWSDNVYSYRGANITVNTDDNGVVTSITVDTDGEATSGLIAFDLVGDSSLTNGSYILNGCPLGGGATTYGLYVNDKGDTGLSNTFGDTGDGASVTITSNGILRPRIIIRSGYVASDLTFYPMLRLATESDATFAPYSNICPITGITTATVQTTDGEDTNTVAIQLGQTVYGGTINFNTGVLTITHVAKTYEGAESESWSYNSTYGFMMISAPTESAAVTPSGLVALSNAYNRQAPANVNTIKNGEFFMNTSVLSQSKYLIIKNDDYTDVATWKTYLSSNNLQIYYPLATPTTLTLTPSTLTMLEGAQTVSGNGETVTVTYEQGAIDYVDKRIPAAPTTDGEYALTCTVTDGVPAYSWEETS